MNRRVVRENCGLHATREEDGKTVRQFNGGSVLNVMQWHKPGFGRFTVEGEGAEVWVCRQETIDTQTDAVARMTPQAF